MKRSVHTDEHHALVKYLKMARLDSKLTQIEVAEKLGYTQSYISKLEAGDAKIDALELKRFAKLYRKDIGYFLK